LWEQQKNRVQIHCGKNQGKQGYKLVGEPKTKKEYQRDYKDDECNWMKNVLNPDMWMRERERELVCVK
jgi:hypothetical protein